MSTLDAASFGSSWSHDLTADVLRHFGWQRAGGTPGLYEVWRLAAIDQEIIYPLDPMKGDYELLSTRATAKLEAIYGKEYVRAIQALEEKRERSLDLTEWKKETLEPAGLIKWTEGEAVIASVRRSLAAAAKATRERRKTFGSRGSYLAKQFVEHTYMGQTAMGSYVVTAHTPSTYRFYSDRRAELAAQVDWRNGVHFNGREILNTLEGALNEIRYALDDYRTSDRIDHFAPLVEFGVSSELASALSDLSRTGDAAITFQRYEHASDETTSRQTVIEARDSVVLAKVAKVFKAAPPATNVELAGEVSSLDNSTSNPTRLIRLDVKAGSDVAHARVRLSQAQYASAVEAHATFKWLAVRGKLEKDGRDFWLYDVEDVSLVDPPAAVVASTFLFS